MLLGGVLICEPRIFERLVKSTVYPLDYLPNNWHWHTLPVWPPPLPTIKNEHTTSVKISTRMSALSIGRLKKKCLSHILRHLTPFHLPNCLHSRDQIFQQSRSMVPMETVSLYYVLAHRSPLTRCSHHSIYTNRSLNTITY